MRSIGHPGRTGGLGRRTIIRNNPGFEDFSLASGMLSTTVNAANSAQNYPKLPKFAKIYPKKKL
jgi:hypothetical protein